MKKFLRKLILLSLPIVLYYTVFLALEPFNYFNLPFREAKVFSTQPLPKMRSAMSGDIKNLLLGDSRTSHFDLNYLEELTGDRYYNLGFGGASLQEEIDLFWWAAKYNKLEKVVLQTGFWTINKNYTPDRIPELQPLAETPLKYLIDLSCHQNAWSLWNDGLTQGESSEPPVYTDEERKENLRYYAEEIIYPGATNYETDWNDIEELRKIAEYCDKNKIELIIAFPPIDQSIWELVVEPLNLYGEMELVKKEISEFATVYDMEYPEMNAYTQMDYADGFHMMGMQDNVDYYAEDFEQTYPALVDYLDHMYNGKTDHMHIWKNGRISET